MKFMFATTVCFMLMSTVISHADSAPLAGYSNADELAKRVSSLVDKPRVKVTSLGETLEKRAIHLITLGEEDVARKPAILILGNTVAPRLVGSEIAMGMAEWVVQHNDDEKVKKLLDAVTVYVIPRPNPDGSERCFRSPSRAVDGNSRKTDDDRDGEVGEDPAEDLNQDGMITMIRWSDPAGDYIEHPQEARLLIKADPKKNERGKYRLEVEGIDNDGDERWNEDAALGVSFDRNFPAKYDYFGLGAGPHQVSEIETRAIADFYDAHPNIAVVVCFSPSENTFHVWKPGGDEKIKTKVQAEDAPFIDYIAEEYRKLHGGKNAPSPVSGAGAFGDWSYLQLGRWTFACQGWWPMTQGEKKEEEKKDAEKKNEGDKEEKKDHDERGKSERQTLAWMDANKIDGFVPWTKAKAGDKDVEVGGFKPFADINPPVAEISPLVEKHVAFVTAIADRFPRLEIFETTVKGTEGVYEVTLKVGNTGYLPTSSKMGQIAGAVYPVNWSLKVPPTSRLVSGHPRGSISVLPGSGGSVELRWLIQVTDPAQRSIEWSFVSPSVGETKHSADLSKDHP